MGVFPVTVPVSVPYSVPAPPARNRGFYPCSALPFSPMMRLSSHWNWCRYCSSLPMASSRSFFSQKLRPSTFRQTVCYMGDSRKAAQGAASPCWEHSDANGPDFRKSVRLSSLALGRNFDVTRIKRERTVQRLTCPFPHYAEDCLCHIVLQESNDLSPGTDCIGAENCGAGGGNLLQCRSKQNPNQNPANHPSHLPADTAKNLPFPISYLHNNYHPSRFTPKRTADRARPKDTPRMAISHTGKRVICVLLPFNTLYSITQKQLPYNPDCYTRRYAEQEHFYLLQPPPPLRAAGRPVPYWWRTGLKKDTPVP